MDTTRVDMKWKPGAARYLLSALVPMVSLFYAFSVKGEPSPSPDIGLTVTEWVIFICDPNVPQASAAAQFSSTLPDFTASRRPAAPIEQASYPSPVGVIRLRGGTADERVDILLENKSGKFLASWPRAQQRSGGLLWENLEPKNEGLPVEPVPSGHWFNRLREPAGAFWTRDGKGERFVLYDVELSYALPLKLKSVGEAKYELTNIGKVALRDVTLYRPQPDGWHTATLAELAPSPKLPSTKAATKPMAKLTATPTTNPGGQPLTLTGQDPATRQVATGASASTAPSTRPATILSLGGKGRKEPHAALAGWPDQLSAVGLPATDFELILSILERHALDPKRLTAVYRLDPTELDRMLRLEVTPQPRTIVRVGLVIALNIDPALGDEVDRLIAALADDDWAKREAAHKQLAQLGLSAKPKLQAALKSKDVEVVYRAEKLIQALTPAVPPAQPQ